MIKKILKTTLILIIALFALQSNAHAAVIVSTDKQVQSGSGTVTVTVTSKQALGAYTLTLTDTAGLTLTGATVGAGGTVKPDNKTITNASDSGITNLGSYTFAVPTVSSDTKYNIKFSITGMETPDLQSVPNETNTATITVTAPIPDPPPAPVDTRSTNANLSDLGINPKEYDFKTFTSPNRTSHTATVPNEIEEVEVWYKQADTKSTVSITAGKGLKVNNGKVSGLQVGKNTITITVTAEAGNTKKYTITVTRKEAGVTVEPPVEEPPVQEPEVPEEPTDNEVTEPGEGIEKLTIAGITLKPEFDTNTYEYEAILEEDIKTLEIDAKTTSDKYRVVVAGNEDLKNGENLITLIVYDAQNTVVATYQVTVMKNTVNQNEINNIFGELKKEEMIKRIAIISALVVIVILIIIYIVMKTKMKKAKNKTNKEQINNKDEETENNLENEFELHNEIEEETRLEDETKSDTEKITEVENITKTENNFENDINFEDIMMKIRNIENIAKTGKLSDTENIEKIEDTESARRVEENVEDILQTDKKKGKHF